MLRWLLFRKIKVVYVMGCSICKYRIINTKDRNSFAAKREKIDKIDKILEMQSRLDSYEEILNKNKDMFSIILEYLDLSGGHSAEEDDRFARRILMRRKEGPRFGMRYVYDQECDKAERLRSIVKELGLFCRENTG